MSDKLIDSLGDEDMMVAGDVTIQKPSGLPPFQALLMAGAMLIGGMGITFFLAGLLDSLKKPDTTDTTQGEFDLLPPAERNNEE